MMQDLSVPYPGLSFGALDAIDGYNSYRCLGEGPLSQDIAELNPPIDLSALELLLLKIWVLGWDDQAFHLLKREMGCNTAVSLPQAARRNVAERSLFLPGTGTSRRTCFTDYGISIGLQAVGKRPSRSSD
jgi:hypothetical protein